MWDLPGLGHEPVSPASAGGLSTTAPPGKPHVNFYVNLVSSTPELLGVSLLPKPEDLSLSSIRPHSLLCASTVLRASTATDSLKSVAVFP